MKEITITKYEANDGTQFNTKEECEKYEARCDKYRLFEIVKTIPHTMVSHAEIFESGSNDSHIVMFKPKNAEQADALEAWCNAVGVDVDVDLKSPVGRTVVIPEAYTGREYGELDDIDTNYLYGSLQTLDNYIGNFARQLVLYSTDIWKE